MPFESHRERRLAGRRKPRQPNDGSAMSVAERAIFPRNEMTLTIDVCQCVLVHVLESRYVAQCRQPSRAYPPRFRQDFCTQIVIGRSKVDDYRRFARVFAIADDSARFD